MIKQSFTRRVRPTAIGITAHFMINLLLSRKEQMPQREVTHTSRDVATILVISPAIALELTVDRRARNDNERTRRLVLSNQAGNSR